MSKLKLIDYCMESSEEEEIEVVGVTRTEERNNVVANSYQKTLESYVSTAAAVVKKGFELIENEAIVAFSNEVCSKFFGNDEEVLNRFEQAVLQDNGFIRNALQQMAEMNFAIFNLFCILNVEFYGITRYLQHVKSECN